MANRVVAKIMEVLYRAKAKIDRIFIKFVNNYLILKYNVTFHYQNSVYHYLAVEIGLFSLLILLKSHG